MSTVVTRFIDTFVPSVIGDADALHHIFSQPKMGYPFFYACENPNEIGFIYTNKRGLTTQKRLYAHSVFTNERVTVEMLRLRGIDGATNLPQLIFNNYITQKPNTPHFRPSSDPNAISLTVVCNDGSRADLRVVFYTIEHEGRESMLVTAADLDHVYGSSYYNYYTPVAHFS